MSRSLSSGYHLTSNENSRLFKEAGEDTDFNRASKFSQIVVDSSIKWPTALVVFWHEEYDNRTQRVGILCPYHGKNGKIEEHVLPLEEFNNGQVCRYLRLCHEQTNLWNNIVFPYETGHPATKNLDFEYNITRHRFQVIGLQMPEFTISETADFSVVVSGPKYPSAMKTDFRRNARNEITDIYGNTYLALASRNGDTEAMESQLISGADIETQNSSGMTPLMEAVGCSNINAVLLLMKYGASKSICNGKGLTAREILEETILSGDSAVLQNKSIIQALLNTEDQLPRRKIDGSLLNFDLLETCHNVGDRTITVLNPMATFKFSRFKTKTLSLLDRGPPYPLVFAASGFKPDVKGPCHFLVSEIWTNKVEEVAYAIGYKLEPHNFDCSYHRNNEPGHVSASHAEKQLIAYAYLKHPKHPRRTIQQLTIGVDHPKLICRGCWGFKDAVEKISGLRFKFIMLTRHQQNLGNKVYPKTPTKRTLRHVSQLDPMPSFPPEINPHQGPHQTTQIGLQTPPSSGRLDCASKRFTQLESESPSVIRNRKRKTKQIECDFEDPFLSPEPELPSVIWNRNRTKNKKQIEDDFEDSGMSSEVESPFVVRSRKKKNKQIEDDPEDSGLSSDVESPFVVRSRKGKNKQIEHDSKDSGLSPKTTNWEVDSVRSMHTKPQNMSVRLLSQESEESTIIVDTSSKDTLYIEISSDEEG